MPPAKVLIADCDAEMRLRLKTQVAQLGLEPVCAITGRQAIQVFVNEVPQAVIMRDALPDFDGWEAAGLLRAISDVPIIFITAHPDRLSRNRALQLGDDYMAAPWRWEQFLARLSALLKRWSAETVSGPYSYDDGNLTVDISGRLVTRHGRPIALTNTEFKLLSCFVKHPDQTLRYSEILQSVWGHTYVKAKSDVSLYVRYLRQKIEDDPAQPDYLHTVRGVGYMFAARSAGGAPTPILDRAVSASRILTVT